MRLKDLSQAKFALAAKGRLKQFYARSIERVDRCTVHRDTGQRQNRSIGQLERLHVTEHYSVIFSREYPEESHDVAVSKICWIAVPSALRLPAELVKKRDYFRHPCIVCSRAPLFDYIGCSRCVKNRRKVPNARLLSRSTRLLAPSRLEKVFVGVTRIAFATDTASVPAKRMVHDVG